MRRMILGLIVFARGLLSRLPCLFIVDFAKLFNRTPMTQGEPKFREALKPAIAIAPMNRMGTPEEIADACLFLCGSGAGFVCGHALVSSLS
jgi:NAD(P)-dependent dehydrogenase (short-subunit alcohol dehydrogenase family)